MKAALDTNILAYAEGVNTAAMKKAALAVIAQLPASQVVLPVQVLGELFHVLVRKAGRTPGRARAAILSWRDSFEVIETSAEILVSAADLATTHQLGIWDSVILCAAAAGECRLLLSEDLQDGFVWNGVTVVNPFAASMHPLLRLMMQN